MEACPIAWLFSVSISFGLCGIIEACKNHSKEEILQKRG